MTTILVFVEFKTTTLTGSTLDRIRALEGVLGAERPNATTLRLRVETVTKARALRKVVDAAIAENAPKVAAASEEPAPVELPKEHRTVRGRRRVAPKHVALPSGLVGQVIKTIQKHGEQLRYVVRLGNNKLKTALASECTAIE